MVVAADKALLARPGYPAARFNLALAHALAGNAEASLGELEALLAAGIDFGVADLDDFAPVRALPDWARFERGVRTRSASPASSSRQA